MMSGKNVTIVAHCDVEHIFEPGVCIACDRDRLRATLAHVTEVLDDSIEGCGNCDYGAGSTGRTSEGEPCECCTDIRELREQIRALLNPDPSAQRPESEPEETLPPRRAHADPGAPSPEGAEAATAGVAPKEKP